jgi:hypothetical protein
MSGELNVTNPDQPKRALIVIANPATSTTLGIPVGFCGAELTHSWLAFKEVGYDVTIASRRREVRAVRDRPPDHRPTAVLGRRGGTARG